MKIAYVYDAVYPEIPGGVQLRIWEVGRRLAGSGHEVHIFSMHCWEGHRTIVREGVTLHGICPQIALYHRGRRSIAEAIFFGIATAAPLTLGSFDLIDCQHFPYFPVFSAKIGAALRKTPLVITWHEVWGKYWDVYLGRWGSFGKAVERMVAEVSPHNLAVSALTARGLSALSGKETTIIPNGIDRDRILAQPVAEDGVDVIYAGRLIREKHVDLLIEAIALCAIEHPDIRCVIIGDGPERNRLQQMARLSGVEHQISFTGTIPSHDEVISRMKAARVFAFPSSREGFGIAALEALACGLALVTADFPQNAAKELVTEKQGFCCAPNAPALASALLTALTRAREMRPHAIAFAESYDWRRIADLHEAYYQKIRERPYGG